MSTPIAPYVCAVCRAPVVAGARFCAQCGTPFAERPPLRVAPPAVPVSTPGAAVPPPPRVPVAPPPPSYGPPPAAPPGTSGPSVYTPAPEEPSRAALWVALVVVLFIGALVGAYLLFAEPPAEGDRAADDADETFVMEPREEFEPATSADEGLDDGSFPDDVFDETAPEPLPSDDELIVPEPGDTGDDDVIDESEPAPTPSQPQPRPEPAPPAEAPASPQLGAAWSTYRSALGAYDAAVRRAGSSDKADAEVRGACDRLIDAGDAVLRIPGRERYAGQIARDRRDC